MEARASHVMLQVWDEHRNLSRKVTSAASPARGVLVLTTQMFGGRQGKIQVVDTESPRADHLQRKSQKLQFRERFRNLLSREFSGWRIAELSTEPNLEHSFSPLFPRAMLVRGSSAIAAMGAGPDAENVSAMLSFALIWLDYLRKRNRKLTVERLVLFVPAETENQIASRLLFLHPDRLRCEVYSYSEEDFVAPIDLQDHGNIDSYLPVCRDATPSQTMEEKEWERWLEAEVRHNLQAIDAALHPAPVYGQVPSVSGKERGISDLLAVDTAGRLAVLELKVSSDIQLPLQGLDYWMRVAKHVKDGTWTAKGYFPGISLSQQLPKLILVAPALAFHPTTETILSFFSSSIEVERIGLAENWQDSLRVMFRLRGAELPYQE